MEPRKAQSCLEAAVAAAWNLAPTSCSAWDPLGICDTTGKDRTRSPELVGFVLVSLSIPTKGGVHHFDVGARFFDRRRNSAVAIRVRMLCPTSFMAEATQRQAPGD